MMSTSSGHDAAGCTLTSITPGSGPMTSWQTRGSVGGGYPSTTTATPRVAAVASTTAIRATASSSRAKGGRNTWTLPFLTSTHNAVAGASFGATTDAGSIAALDSATRVASSRRGSNGERSG